MLSAARAHTADFDGRTPLYDALVFGIDFY